MFSIVWWLFVLLVGTAAAIDVTSYRIPNALVLALILLFGLVALLHRTEVPWLSHLGAFTLVAGGGIFLYGLGQMGAGDVKLLSALSLWSGVYALVALLFWISLCALGGMLIILLLRRLAPRLVSQTRPLPRVLRKKEGIPFAIGIGPGAIIAALSFEPWLWQL